MLEVADKIPITCTVTGKTAETRPLKDGSPGLPPGWKKLAGEYYSPEAWTARFVPRAIRLPVASVEAVDGTAARSPDEKREAWKLFRACLRTSWRQATQAANWFVTEIAKCDNAPLLAGPKGPKLPPLDLPMAALLKQLYSYGREHCPDLDSQSMTAVRQRVVARYKEDRWEVRVRGSKSLPSFRYPYPVPVPAATYTLKVNDQGQPLVTCRVAGHRFTVRLRSGRYHGDRGPTFDFRRQTAVLAKAAAGALLAGELSIYQRATSGSQHRNGGRERVQAGANGTPTEILYSFSCWLPKEPGLRTEAKVVVRTGPDRLWSVFLEGREQCWDLHEDHLKSLVVGHKARLFRLSHDTKFERRVPRAAGAGLASVRERLIRQNKKRIDDLVHKAALMLVGFARRNQAGVIEYDDRDPSWCPALCWFKLRELVKQKAEQLGINFVRVGSSDAEAADAMHD